MRLLRFPMIVLVSWLIFSQLSRAGDNIPCERERKVRVAIAIADSVDISTNTSSIPRSSERSTKVASMIRIIEEADQKAEEAREEAKAATAGLKKVESELTVLKAQIEAMKVSPIPKPSAPSVPTGKAGCICGPECQCPAGKCGGSCLLTYNQVLERVQAGKVTTLYVGVQPPDGATECGYCGTYPGKAPGVYRCRLYEGYPAIESIDAKTTSSTSVGEGLHSHTCSHGHTWSHDGGPGSSHNCPVCGEYNNVVSGIGSHSRSSAATFSYPVFGAPACSSCSNGRCQTGR